MEAKSISIPFAGRNLVFETGKLATLAPGSVMVKFGDIHLLVTAVVSEKARDGVDFLPLTVDFQEKFYASGKIKGSRFLKREGGRPSDDQVLISRLIDRPIRPMLPKEMRNDIQVLATVFSTDKSMNTGPFALTAASLALNLSGAPMETVISSVRVGQDSEGNFILMPTYQQIENGQLDLVVAGTEDAITMVEAKANEISDDKILQALDFAHTHIKALCQLQTKFLSQFDIKKIVIEKKILNEDLVSKVKGIVTDEMIKKLYYKSKKEFAYELKKLTEQVVENFTTEIEQNSSIKADIEEAVYKTLKKHMRSNILTEGVRLDGRKIEDVRLVSAEVSVLPRTHGSAVFNRGETQIMGVVTLGGPSSIQIDDSMDTIGDKEIRFWHHYTFLPFSIGETGQMRSAGRREIGHGKLGEKAIESMLPAKENFPYTIAVVSETLSCNGSSSMGSICAASLALMDAGVPIKAPVTGIAMGLIMDEETGQYKILSDIQAQEDFLGDMDFKVAGTSKGITALQMDIKVKGLKLSLLKEALSQSNAGRQYIWNEMSKALATPREKINQYAPLIASMQIDTDDIRLVIGKGGETIQGITKECGVEINIDDDGVITITAPDGKSGNKAAKMIKNIVYKPQVGDTFEGKVVRIADFGAFVEFLPGKDGLVHVSELANDFVKNVEDVVKMGQIIAVKIIGIDDMGRYKLSHTKAMKDVKGV